jgi:small conductance mechanosensitive channel
METGMRLVWWLVMGEMQIAGVKIVQVVEIVVGFAVTYLLAKLGSKLLERLFERTPFPEEVEHGILKASKYVIYVLGLFAIVSVVGVDITSILVGLGAFSIAISFATSNIIQNFVSGVIVMGDRAFKVGDEVKIQAYEGRVMKIGIRTTVIQDKDENTVFIPNSLFISNPVTRKNDSSDTERDPATESPSSAR